MIRCSFAYFTYSVPETTIERILTNRDSYDDKEVTVFSAVLGPEVRTLKVGNRYTIFSLIGDSGR